MNARDISTAEPFRPRPVRFIELWHEHGWRFKAYTISRGGAVVGDELLGAARGIVRTLVAESATAAATHHYGVGFVGVHQGRGGNVVFVDWWCDENELRHHVFSSGPASPGTLRYETPAGLAGCVWDIGLVHFERQAWVRTALRAPGPAALDDYLAVRAEGDL